MGPVRFLFRKQAEGRQRGRPVGDGAEIVGFGCPSRESALLGFSGNQHGFELAAQSCKLVFFSAPHANSLLTKLGNS